LIFIYLQRFLIAGTSSGQSSFFEINITFIQTARKNVKKNAFINSTNIFFLEVVSYTVSKPYTGRCWHIGLTALGLAVKKRRPQQVKLHHIEKITERKKDAAGLIYQLIKQLEYGWKFHLQSPQISKMPYRLKTAVTDSTSLALGSIFPFSRRPHEVRL
jgi:hypothetical protein